MAAKSNEWVVRGTLSEGGQGVVFLVEDSTGDRPGRFVLKRLKNLGRLDLFEREVKATLALNHPSILRIIVANMGEKPYYVAEYCEGGTLWAWNVLQYVRQGRQTRDSGKASSGWFRSSVGNYAGCDLGVLRCNHCGHLEWFDFSFIDDGGWWDR